MSLWIRRCRRRASRRAWSKRSSRTRRRPGSGQSASNWRIRRTCRGVSIPAAPTATVVRSRTRLPLGAEPAVAAVDHDLLADGLDLDALAGTHPRRPFGLPGRLIRTTPAPCSQLGALRARARRGGRKSGRNWVGVAIRFAVRSGCERTATRAQPMCPAAGRPIARADPPSARASPRRREARARERRRGCARDRRWQEDADNADPPRRAPCRLVRHLNGGDPRLLAGAARVIRRRPSAAVGGRGLPGAPGDHEDPDAADTLAVPGHDDPNDALAAHRERSRVDRHRRR